MFEINGHTKQLAIIGDPVEHSFSPQMHNYISEKTGKNYVYTALEVHPKNLKDAVNGIRAMGIAGVNVTAPHKFEVMQYLDEISDRARKFGSVNTCVNRNGRLYGYNTDADGFYQSLLHEGIAVKDRDVLIVGAGGATQPIVILFAMEGAKSITILNRTEANALRLAEYAEKTVGYHVETERKLLHYDVIINTTSVGMWPEVDGCPLADFSFVDEKTAAADMIYNPEETVFLRKAKERGAKTVNGLGMLIFQGIIAYELFTDTKLPEGIYEEIAKEVFGK
mgnify:CR=1 FL=1